LRAEGFAHGAARPEPGGDGGIGSGGEIDEGDALREFEELLRRVGDEETYAGIAGAQHSGRLPHSGPNYKVAMRS
jgi:hypothetical protein